MDIKIELGDWDWLQLTENQIGGGARFCRLRNPISIFTKDRDVVN